MSTPLPGKEVVGMGARAASIDLMTRGRYISCNGAVIVITWLAETVSAGLLVVTVISCVPGISQLKLIVSVSPEV
jgi:hypothetical protein